MGMGVGRCSCKYVELGVTDGLEFWDCSGRYLVGTGMTGIVRNMAMGSG